MAERNFDTAAVILAGGAASRMGAAKPFVALGRRRLIEHGLARLEPQVARVYVNPREGDARFAALGRPLAVDDPRWPGAGPLAGVAAAMRLAGEAGFRFLATAPCDAPFLPEDLAARLRAPVAAGAAAAVAVSRFGWEPMFALWRTESLPWIEAALEEGRASPRGTLARLGAVEVRFAPAGAIDAFANLNTPEDLAAAEAALARIPAIAPGRAGEARGDEA